MSNLSQAFGNLNKDSLRIRSFEFGGHTFKVKVPLTAESDAMFERLKNPDEELLNKFYAELSKDFTEESEQIKFVENDILIEGRSIRETAKNKALIQARITEMFKMLVPEEVGFDMSTITYEMIDEMFPFAIQMQLMELIGETVSPNYNTTKGK
jgi:hypothetical protein